MSGYGSTKPTGSMRFTAGGGAITGCTAQSLSPVGATLVSTCTTTFGSNGTQSLGAAYSGDYIYTPTTGSSTLTVAAQPTTLINTDSAHGTLSHGGTDTITATVTPQYSGAPLGTVAFKLDGTTYPTCTAQAVSSSAATCAFSSSALTIGSHTVSTAYTPTSSNFAASASTNLTITVTPAATTTALTASPTSPSVGQSVTLTATVAGSGASPTGTVAFTASSVPISGCSGKAVSTTAGVTTATCTTQFASQGTSSLSATYSGDANYQSSTTTQSLTVGALTSTVTISASPTAAQANQPTTLTAAVSGAGAAPTGTVVFTDGSTPISGCTAQPLSTTLGVTSATCNASFATQGSHALTATYSGDTTYGSATSTATSLSVSSASTTTTLTDTAGALITYGATDTLTATIVPAYGSAPTGTVAFSLDGTSINACVAQPLTTTAGTTTATCALASSTLTGGSHALTAVYNPQTSTFATSTSQSFALLVNTALPTLIISSNPTTPVAGQLTTLTATLTTAGVSPTGTVTFQSAGVTITGCLAVPVVTTSGITIATCTTNTFATAGTHPQTALYSGDPNYSSITSPSLSLTVAPASTTLTNVDSAGGALTYGSTDTLTTTITPLYGGSPTGTLSYTLDSAPYSPCTTQPLTTTAGTTTATCTLSASALTAGMHYVTTSYTPTGTTYTASTSPSFAINVAAASSTTALTVSPSPTVVGATTTVTATITTNGTTAPTGTVNFKIAGSAIPGCAAQSVFSGMATCNTTFPTAGTQTLSAVYSGDSNYTGSTGSSALTVNSASTTIANTDVATGSVTYGSSDTVTSTLTPQYSGTPAGTLSYSLDGTTYAPCSAQTLATSAGTTTATCQFPSSALTVGTHSVVSTYNPTGGNFTTSSSASLTITVTTGSTTTALTSSPNPTTVGASTTLTATVSGPAVTPTGTVNFQRAGVTITGCASQPLNSGVASCATTFAATSTQSLTALYSGDANYSSSRGSQSLSVRSTASSVALAAAPSSVSTNQAVTLTATTTGPGVTPTGTINFQRADTTITGCASQPLTSGTASCTTSFAATGTQSLTAVYSGDTNYTANTSPTTPLSVTAASTTTTTTDSAGGSLAYGSSDTITAAITTAFGGTPPGTVSYTLDGTTYSPCSAQPLTTTLGVTTATCALPPPVLTAGNHHITATYNPSGSNYTTSTSSSFALVVSAGPSSIALAAAPSPTAVGATTTLTSTVFGSTATPTGTVSFSDGATPITSCTTQPLTTSQGTTTATCTTTFTTQGTHTLTATYSGDPNYQTSTTPSTQLTAATDPTTTTLTDTAGGVLSYGPSDTLTASVTPLYSLALSGTVSFSLDSVAYPSCQNLAVPAPTCTLNVTALTPGTHNVTAAYTPATASSGASTSTSFQIQVSRSTPAISVTTPPTTPIVGQPTTLTSTLSGPGSAPTGTVSFFDGPTPITSCQTAPITTQAGVTTATCSTPFATATTHSLTAIYSGDANYYQVTSPSTRLSVGTATTTVSLIDTAAGATAYGNSDTVTATVTPSYSGAPTGTVAFYLDSAPVSSCAQQALNTQSTPQATCRLSPAALVVGGHSITAIYSGDSNYAGSSASGITVTVGIGSPASTALTTQPSLPVVGQPATLTATVSGPGVAPAGTVEFSDGSDPIAVCSAQPLITTSGITTATCITPFATAATHQLTATYSGDSDYTTSQASSALTVATASTTTVLADSSSGSVSYATQDSFTAAVGSLYGVTPTGTITFSVAQTPYSSCTNLALVAGTATCALTTTALAAGTYAIQATYTPATTDFAQSTSQQFQLSVTKAQSALGLIAQPTPAVVGTPYQVTATLSGPGRTPSGTVSFSTSSGVIPGCATRPVATGTATCVTSPATTTPLTITAAYSGDQYYTPTTGHAALTVSPGNSITQLQLSTTSPDTNAQVTLTATAIGSGTAPTGSYTFTANSHSIAGCTARPLVAAKASCTTSFTTAGRQLIAAAYSGDANYQTSNSQTSLTVSQPTSPPPSTLPTAGSNLTGPVVGMAATPRGTGYWLSGANGSVDAFGTATFYGSMATQHLNSPIDHIVATNDGHGYWLVAADGGTFAFGDAGFYGSMGAVHLNSPVVDIAPTADGRGYWLVASDGGIFAFGDAAFHGSMGAVRLNRPVVGVAADPSTGGYWEVASDGGVFAFGAPFYGSTGALTLNAPINSMAPSPSGHGYWFVASDGGLFAFGDAGFHGSASGPALSSPVVGMAADPATGGYWEVCSDGMVYNFAAPFYGAH